jgi:hypothetical protein
MLKLAALVNKMAVGRKSHSRNILSVLTKQKLSYASRLFSSLSSDDQNESDDINNRPTREAKPYKGLTRMRVKKVIKPEPDDNIGDL